jgi:recombinational DNA repair ATPase RecF
MILGIKDAPLGRCFLLDDTLSVLMYDEQRKMLEQLSQSKNQVVVSTREYEQIKGVKANVVYTKDFELRGKR